MRFGLIVSLCVFGSLFGVGAVSSLALAPSSDEFWTRANSDLDAINEFNEIAFADGVSDASIIDQADDLLFTLSDSVDYYERESVSSEDGGKTVAQGITAYRNALRNLRTSHYLGNSLGVNSTVAAMNRAADQINVGLSSSRQTAAGKERRNRQLIIACPVLSSIITILLFIAAKWRAHTYTDHISREWYWKMFLSSLIPTIGLLITFATYEHASGGGRYFVAYGAVLFGGLNLARNAFHYFTSVRPQLQYESTPEGLIAVNFPGLSSAYASMSEDEFLSAMSRTYKLDRSTAMVVRADLEAAIHERGLRQADLTL